MNPRRAILKTAISILAALATALPAKAEDYPTRPIRLIVPFAPGGNTDVAGRMIANGISPLLGQPVVVDNRGGAGGSIAAGFVAKSPADGYTILLASGALAINPSIYDKVPYDLSKDFDPVGLAMVTGLVIVASPKLGVKTLPELLAAAKAAPGKLTYGSAGIGSGSHLAGELFNQTAQIRAMHVPYKGSGPATAAVFSGEVDYTFSSLAAAAPMVKSGKVVALAVTGTGKNPSPLYPGIPTTEGLGVKGFDAGDWIGLVVPSGTPKATIERLNAALTKWLATPEAKLQLAQAGFDVKASNPTEFRSLIDADFVKWQRIAKVAGIKAE